jgi:type I restriction enzyme S subunit
MSDAWQTQSLGNVITLKRGYDLRKVDLSLGDVPVISSSGLMGYHNIAKVNGPGVVTGRYGTIGEVYYVEEDFWPLNTTLYVEDFKGNYPLFIYYLLQALDFRKFSDKTGVPGVNRNDLHKINVAIPSMPEQQKISEILNAWDKLIKLMEQAISAKQRFKEGLTQQLLSGEKRFPEFQGQRCRETTLEEFFLPFTRRNTENEDLTVLSCSTIHGIVPQTRIFGKRIASVNTQRYKVIEKGDLVYDPMLLWDASIGFLEEVERGIVSPAYSTFKFRKGAAVRDYFKYLLKTHYYRERYKLISQGTNVRRKKAPVEAFLKLSVRLPSSIEEIRKITEFLQYVDSENSLLTQKLSAVVKQKKGLAQKLLSGQIRVKV